MSDNPNTVTAAVQQTNSNGNYSRTHYNSFVPVGGDPAAAPRGIVGGTGFTAKTSVGAKEGTGDYGTNDQVKSNKLVDGVANEISVMVPGSNSIPESPFRQYNKKPLSNGGPQTEEKYYTHRKIGRPINMSEIRNGCYWDPSEADLFSLGPVSSHPVGNSLEPMDRSTIQETREPKTVDV